MKRRKFIRNSLLGLGALGFNITSLFSKTSNDIYDDNLIDIKPGELGLIIGTANSGKSKIIRTLLTKYKNNIYLVGGISETLTIDDIIKDISSKHKYLLINNCYFNNPQQHIKKLSELAKKRNIKVWLTVQLHRKASVNQNINKKVFTKYASKIIYV